MTLDQLKKWESHLANRCSLCGENEKARDLESLLFALFSITWILPCLVRETLLGWQGSSVRKKHEKIWMQHPSCLFWIVWRERNRTIIDDEMPFVQRMKSSFGNSLWSWGRLVTDFEPFHVSNFLFCLGNG